MTSTSRTDAPAHRTRHGAIAVAVAALIAALAAGAALFIGGQATAPGAVVAALVGDADATTSAIVWDVRMPRTAAAIVAGAGLGLAASLLQTITGNPVADAGLLGSNAGAAVTISAGIALGLAPGILSQSLWALAGSLLATGFVCIVGLSGRIHSITRFVLLGVALGAVLLGITNGIMLAVPEAFEGMRHWLAGSMVGVPLPSSLVGAIVVAVAIVLCLSIAPALELTLLGDDAARALGARLLATRAVAVVAVALASATATALVGPIGFVGLIAAHLAAVVAAGQGLSAGARHLLAGGAGATILVVADVVGRVALWPGELPAGIVAAVVGAPFLLWIVRRARSLT